MEAWEIMFSFTLDITNDVHRFFRKYIKSWATLHMSCINGTFWTEGAHSGMYK